MGEAQCKVSVGSRQILSRHFLMATAAECLFSVHGCVDKFSSAPQAEYEVFMTNDSRRAPQQSMGHHYYMKPGRRHELVDAL
jgi:hypothetical protein